MSTYPGPVTVGIHQVVREIGVIREYLIVTASHLPSQTRADDLPEPWQALECPFLRNRR